MATHTNTDNPLEAEEDYRHHLHALSNTHLLFWEHSYWQVMHRAMQSIQRMHLEWSAERKNVGHFPPFMMSSWLHRSRERITGLVTFIKTVGTFMKPGKSIKKKNKE